MGIKRKIAICIFVFLGVLLVNTSAYSVVVKKPSRPAPNYSITSTTIPLVVGKNFRINGQGFGTRQGRVVFLMDGRLWNCTVRSWSNTTISCTAPSFGYGHGRYKSADLWVKLSGREVGPMKRGVRLWGVRPYIRSISPTTVSPGEEFTISGSGFNRGSIGRLTYRVSGNSISVSVVSWSNTEVTARLSRSVSGIASNRGTLTLKNGYGNEDSKTLSFEAARETVTLKGRTVWITTPFGAKKYQEQEDFKNKELINGWKVRSVSIKFEKRKGRTGVNYLVKPSVGSRRPYTKTKGWASGPSGSLWYHVEVIISGPKGVRPYWR